MERPDHYLAELTEELSAKAAHPPLYFRLMPIDIFQQVRKAANDLLTTVQYASASLRSRYAGSVPVSRLKRS